MAVLSQWKRRLARVRSMRIDEFLDRVRQQVTMRVDAWRYRRGHDFAGDLRECTERPHGHFFFAPPELPAVCEILTQRFPRVAREIVAQAGNIRRHRFDLMGYENLDYGPEIDWHSDIVHGKRAPRKPWFKVRYLDFDEVGDSKITWELNRHQHLVTLAKAYVLTGDEGFAREVVAQWKGWQAENPYPMGVNWASSLEVAFRSLSWIWVYFLISDSCVMTAELRREWLRALTVGGRHIETFLSTYFSPNTHLLGEAVALFFLGTLFREFPRAERWKQRGWKIVLDSMAKQVRPDGFYFEQSTYYHVYALDMFLHARILAAANDVPIPATLDQGIAKMLDVLFLLGRAGVPALVGDDDGGRWFDGRRNRAEHLLDPLSTGAVLFSRGDFKALVGNMREETLWLLGTRGLAVFDALRSSEGSVDSVALLETGFYLMADAEAAQQLFIDGGPHGPGHGHADALSVQLVRRGSVLLMDPGTCEYVGESGERPWYRGTAAHNTMRVDGLDQAEGLGPFAWVKPPSVRVEQWAAGRHFDVFVGSHDGYTRLQEAVVHRRWIFHRKGQFWLVRDVAEGHGKHRLELTWHLGGTVAPVSTKDNLFADGQNGLALVTAEGHGWALSAHRGNWSPVYGHMERATVLTFGLQGELPAELATVLLPEASLHRGLGRLERMGSDPSLVGYRYAREGQAHHFLFANRQGPWTFENWASDARFLYWAWDRERDLRLLVMCGGSYAEAGGASVFMSRRAVDYAEVVSSASATEVFTSDPDDFVLQGSLDRIDLDLAMPGAEKGEGL
jgi:hypothetical protein